MPKRLLIHRVFCCQIAVLLVAPAGAFARDGMETEVKPSTEQRPIKKRQTKTTAKPRPRWAFKLRSIASLRKSIKRSKALRKRRSRALRKKRSRALRKKRRRAYRKPAVRNRSVGWGGGERLTFKVRLGSISIGRSAISVGGTRKGSKVIKMRALGETLPLLQLLYRLREELITVADLGQGLFPRRTISVREKGKQRRKVVTQHGWVTKQEIERIALDTPAQTKPGKRKRRFSRRPFDALTALFHLRSVDLAAKKRIDLTLLAGTALHRVQLQVKGTEQIITVLGPRRCHRLHGWAWRIDDRGRLLKNKPRRRVLMWLTADRAQVPVRVSGDTDLGYVTAELSSYKPATHTLVASVALRP